MSAILTPKELASELRVTEQTLKNWRGDPRNRLPFIRVGRAVRYRREDVERFLASSTVRKAEEGGAL